MAGLESLERPRHFLRWRSRMSDAASVHHGSAVPGCMMKSREPPRTRSSGLRRPCG